MKTLLTSFALFLCLQLSFAQDFSGTFKGDIMNGICQLEIEQNDIYVTGSVTFEVDGKKYSFKLDGKTSNGIAHVVMVNENKEVFSNMDIFFDGPKLKLTLNESQKADEKKIPVRISLLKQ